MDTSPHHETTANPAARARCSHHGRGAAALRLIAAAVLAVGAGRAEDPPAPDPFAVPATLASHAAFSCQSMIINGGFVVDSRGLAGGGMTNQGHVRSNGDITVNGTAQVRGDATAGPGKLVRLNGGATVTGTRSSAAAATNCRPLDLAPVRTALELSNDNARIPLTAKGKKVLGGSGGRAFTLNANDSLLLPGGTYLFSSLTINGNGIVTLGGPVRILSTGAVTLNGGGRFNHGGDPLDFRLWSAGTGVTLNGASVVAGFVYAPDASATINGGARLDGGVFAKTVTLNGNSFLTRVIVDQPALAVTIASPAGGTLVHGCAVPVSGAVTGGTGAVTVAVNGIAVTPSADGSFAATVDIAGVQSGRIAAVATDESGATATAEVTVAVATPVASLLSPAPGSLVSERIVALSGSCTDAIAVAVNGVPAAVAGGAWTIAAFDLGEDGSRPLAIAATNCAGATATAGATLELDTAPPAITIASPIDGDVVLSRLVSVSGTVADAHLASVAVNGIAATVADGRFTAADIPVAAGATAVTATATDTLGRSSSATVTVTLDTVPPGVTIDDPATGAGACLPASPTVRISGSFSDPSPATGETPAVTVAVTSATGASTAHVATLAPDGRTWSVDGVDLGAADGTATATAIATDSLGNTARVSRSWRIDASAPTVRLTLDGAPFPGAGDGAAPPAGAATTLLNRVVAPRVEVADGAAAPPSAALTLDGAPYVAGTPIIAEGEHLLVATATDCAEHTATAYAFFRLDRTAPALQATTPADGAVLTEGPASFDGAADGELASATIDGRAATVSGSSFSFAPIAWHEGENTVTIELADAAGNTASFVRRFTVHSLELRVEILDGALPIAAGTTYLRALAPVVRASDPAATVSATLNGAPFESGTPVSSSGTYDLAATATNVLGRTASASVSFTIDREPGPTISITAPADGENVPGPTVAVTGTVGGRSPVVTVNGVSAAVAGESWTATVAVEAGVVNLITAAVTDAAGRGAGASVSVFVPAGGPQVLILAPADGTLTNRPRIDVAGAVAGGRRITADGTVTVAGSPVAVAEDGSFRALDVPLAEGETIIAAEARDEHGRLGRATVTVTADLTPPTVALLADGQRLDEGASLPVGFALRVAVTDNLPDAPPPDVRLDGAPQVAGGSELELVVAEPGGHLVAVVARDRAGNHTRVERSFSVGGGGCTLADLEPASGTFITQDAVTVRGRTATAAAVTVRVPAPGQPSGFAEYPALLADGTFLAGDVPLPIVGESLLQVVCRDAAGAEATMSLAITRVAGAGPALALAAPLDGTREAATSVVVAGSVSDGGAAVTINGAPVKVVAQPDGTGTFTMPALALAEGPNVIAAHAADAVGRTGDARVVVWRDTTAPGVQITSPDDGVRVGVPPGAAVAIEVGGLVDLSNEPNLASVVATTAQGSVTAAVDPATGVFTATVPLDATAGAAQVQTITVTAADTLGNVGTSTVGVYLDPTGPALLLATPAELARFTEASPSPIAVTGEAWALEGAQIAVNGATLAPSSLAWEAAGGDGRRHVAFSVEVATPASDGPFAIVAQVTELDGRSAQARRLLVRDTQAPAVIELHPQHGETGVDRNALALALFSETVRADSLAGPDGLTLVRVATGEPVAAQLAIAGRRRCPGARRRPRRRRELHACAPVPAIADLAGHPLAAPVESTFTVAASAAAMAPAVDPLGAVACGEDDREIVVRGAAAAGATVRVRIASLTFSGLADAAGRFAVAIPRPASGYHVLRVQAIGRDGAASAETAVALRVDCSGPTVTGATFDRDAGLVTVTFSEPIDETSVALGAALVLCDAELPAICDTTAALAWSADGAALEVALDLAPDAWWRDRPVRLAIGPPAADLNANPLAVAFTVDLLSEGGGAAGAFLSGEAYDDATGRPLAGVRVRLFGSAALLPGAVSAALASPAFFETTTDARGRYVFTGAIAAGRHVVLLERDGFSRAVRRLALEPATGAVAFDARLTPLPAAAGTLDPLAGGTLAGPQGSGLSLEVDPGAVGITGPLAVRLTPLGGQGLPEPLPLGWTPVAAADVRLETEDAALPEGAATPFAAAGVRLAVPLASWVLPEDALVAVAYTLRTGTWITLGEIDRGAPELARVALAGPGTVAIVRADDGATAPPVPAAAAGQVLLGAALATPLPQLAAALALDPPVVAPTGRARARVAARSADATTPWPSGLAVQAYLSEKLVLAGGGELLEAPFATDLVLYHPRLTAGELNGALPEAAGACEFAVSPSPRAAEVLLETGWEDIRLYPFPEQLDRGAVLGAVGGSVASPDGVELSVPEGALSERTVIGIQRLSAAELGDLTPIAGFDILDGVRLSFAGRALARAATLSLDVPAATPPALPGDPRLVLAELDGTPADGGASFARVVARITRVPGVEGAPERLVAAPEAAASGLPLDGVVREGTYLVLAAQQPIGFATGFVRTPALVALVASRTATAGLGTADLSRDGGRYSIPVPAGESRIVTAEHPTLDESGSATIAALAPGAVAALDIVVRAVGPQIVPPPIPEPGSEASVGTPITLTFSEPLDPASVTAATLALELATAASVPTGAFIAGTVTLESGVTVLFTPSYPLPPGRRFIARFSGGVRDATGTPYDGPVPFEWSFTTNTVIPTGGQVHPEKFHIRIPVDGVAELYGDDGAVPVGWTVTPEVEGQVVEIELATCPSDTWGGFGRNSLTPCQVGLEPNPPVSITSVVWVKVFAPSDPEVPAAHFRVGPFVSPDGRGFVAPAGQATTFTTADGVTVDVPEGAFAAATEVRITTLPPADLGIATPQRMALASYLSVDFAGEAAESLVLKLPAPPEVPDDALVAVGAPVDLPWGRRLRVLAIGGVLTEGGQRYFSNDPQVMPEPEAGTVQGQASRATGHGPRVTAASGSERRTCADAKREGADKCFLETLLLQLSIKTEAALLWAPGSERALVVGEVSDALAQQFVAVYDMLIDDFVYMPPPTNWSGHYVLPVLTDQPLRIVERSTATGWITGERDYDPIPPVAGGFIDKGKIKDEPARRPLLIDASPFDLVRFRAPARNAVDRLTMEIEAVADRSDRVTLRGATDSPFEEGTAIAVYDLEPALPLDDQTEPSPPVAGPTIQICGDGSTWSTQPFGGSDELLAVITPPDLDALDVRTIELQFDRDLVDLAEVDPATIVTLTDLGEAEGCDAPSATPQDIPVLLDQTVGKSRLVITPNGGLAAGHRFRLTLKPEGIKAKAADGSELAYWSSAPTVFEFGTRALDGEPVGSGGGGADVARDLLRFGNLTVVGSASGRLVAYDTTDHSQAGKFVPFAVSTGAADQVRAFATDGHNRLFFNAWSGARWNVKAVRIEDVRGATTDACPEGSGTLPCFAPVAGGVQVSYEPGYGVDWSEMAQEWLALQSMPTAIPVDMEVLVQDEQGRPLDLKRFYEAYSDAATGFDALEPDGDGLYTFDIPLESTYRRGTAQRREPSLPEDSGPPEPLPEWRKQACPEEPPYDRYQRVTVDNLTTGQSWSLDIENTWPDGSGDGTYRLQRLRARRNDTLRVRYNVRALGYIALMGSGISVVDLNRFYGLPQPGVGRSGGQCGRRLANYQGEDLGFPDCAGPGASLTGLDLTSSVAVHSSTECTGGVCRNGAASINIYSPRVHIGVVRTYADETEPGDLREGELAGCIKQVAGRHVQLRDVALANDMAWTDHGIRGTLAGSFSPPPAGTHAKPADGDLLFVTLGDAGIFVFDVTSRRVGESTLIGHLYAEGHAAFRLEVDTVRSLLFAGGFDGHGTAIIDVWDLGAVNGAPNTAMQPVPRLTLEAPWTTNHLGLDPAGTGLLYTWGAGSGPLAIPFAAAQAEFAGLYLPAPEDMPTDPEQRPHAVERLTSGFAPLAVPLHVVRETDPEMAKTRRDQDERAKTAALKLRLALPGSFGPELTAKVQSLRALPSASRLGQEDVGAAVALPGGKGAPGWDGSTQRYLPEVLVHLRRVGVGLDDPEGGAQAGGEAGRFSTAFNLYESVETVLLVADPRSGREYRLQDVPDDIASPHTLTADEKGACRRCDWPSYLPDPKDDDPDDPQELDRIRELLVGGAHVRMFLAVDPQGEEQVKADTQTAIDFFADHEDSYPAPAAVAQVAGWADAVPSPLQHAMAEPPVNGAFWSPGEAGVSIALTSGEAILTATDFSWQGRALPVALQRSYRSGTLGYGPLGSAGWHSPLFAHLRENGVTAEVEYHDGTGNVYRFYPRSGEKPPAEWEDDPSGSYYVPKGLFLRLVELKGGQGWQLIGRQKDSMRFDASGRLIELSDRLRHGAKDARTRGNTLRFHHDVFGQLTSVEDEYGRAIKLSYWEDPRPVSAGGDGPRYGLLKKVTDWVEGSPRTVEYEFDDQRRLVKVKLPEVSNPVGEYAQFSYTGPNRPTIEYRYDPSANVTDSSTDTTAILHGDFAALRLEGFEHPGSDVLRARFEYDAATGRVKTVAFPDTDDANASGSGVQWKIEYPVEGASAAPATRATVKTPWSHDLAYTVENGRARKIEEANIPTLVGDAATPTPETLATEYTYDNRGRVTQVKHTPDGTTSDNTYASTGDLLDLGNILTTVTGGLHRAFEYLGLEGSSGACPSSGESSDNIPVTCTDALGRRRTEAVPILKANGELLQYVHSGVCTRDGTPLLGAATDFDLFGRMRSQTTKSGEGSAAVRVRHIYGRHPSNQNGGGFLESVEEGGETKYLSYDAQGNVKHILGSLGSSETKHDEWDRPAEEKDGISTGAFAAVNATTQRAWDSAGRLVRERSYQTPLGWVETRWEYNARDQVTAVTQTDLAGPAPGGSLVEATTTTSFDASGRPITVTSPAGIVTTTTYDVAGRIASTRTGESGERKAGYDALSRLVWTTDGDEGMWRGRHNAAGLLEEETLPTGAVIVRTFDEAGELTAETTYSDASRTAILAKTEHEPSGFGPDREVAQVITLGGGGAAEEKLITRRTFDLAGRETRVTQGPTGSERTVVARAFEELTGKLITVEDAVGNLIEHTYAGTPLPSAITLHEAGGTAAITTALTRDALGRVIASDTAGTRTETVLDEAGHVLSETTGGIGIETAYDAQGLVRQLTRKGTGLLTRYGYDADGRELVAETMRDSGESEQTVSTYDASGRLATRQRPGAAPELFTYYPDDMVRTHRTRLRSAAGVALLLTFLYDPGNRVLARETNAAELNASLPAGLAALDAGDAFTWEALSRPKTIDHRTGPEPTDIDLAARVAYSAYDLAGNPGDERVGLWPPAERLHRTFDAFGNATGLTLPADRGITPTLASLTATFDTLDRLTAVDAGATLSAGYTWQGAGKPAGISPQGANALSASLGYGAPGGRLGALSFTSSSGPLGGFTVGWQPATGLKTTRAASGGGSPASLVTALDWQWSHDAAARLAQARTGVASARTRDEWTLSFGSADELRLIHSDRTGPASFTAGAEGRPVSRQDADGSEAFVYGDEGRRIEDARAAYTYDWRGRLVQADIKTPPEGSDEPSAGHRIAYTYDALGRLSTRTHFSEVPEGGSDEQREFIDKQQLLWDGDALLSITGLNFHDEVIWRQHLVPGPSGLDDAPQVLVETGVNGTPRQRTFDLVRDELGSVIAVIEEPEAPEAKLPLLARVFYSVTGEAHLEAGPEPMWIEYAPDIDEVGGQTQAEPVEGERVGGALSVRTTMALDAPTWAEGVRFETWDDQAQQWVAAPPSEYAIGADEAHAEDLRIMRLAGWEAGGRYRITLLPSLGDAFARPIQLPSAEAQGLQVVLAVPTDGVTPPAYARDFPLEYDSVASASNTLCEWPSPTTCEPRFPAGMTHLWQGAWTDPVTGLGYHRERWLDTRNGVWLSEDAGDWDSTNLFAAMGWRQHELSDPLGLAAGSYELWAVQRHLGSTEPGDAAALAMAESAVGGAGEEAERQLHPGASREVWRTFTDPNASLNEKLLAGTVGVLVAADIATNWGAPIKGAIKRGVGRVAGAWFGRAAGRGVAEAAARNAAARGAGEILGGGAEAAARALGPTSVEQGRDALGRYLPRNGGELRSGGPFEDSLDALVREYADAGSVARQLQVKTASGQRPIIDSVARFGGKPFYFEAKGSATASLTRPQRLGYLQIHSSGAVVVSRTVQQYRAGTLMLPGRVRVVRPEDLARLRAALQRLRRLQGGRG